MSAPAVRRARRDFELRERSGDEQWTAARLLLADSAMEPDSCWVTIEHEGRQHAVRLDPAQMTALAWELLSRAAGIGRAR